MATRTAADRRQHARYELCLIGSESLNSQDISRALTGLPEGFDSGAVTRGLSAGGATPVTTGDSVKELEPLQYHLWECGIRTLIREQPDRRRQATLVARVTQGMRRLFGTVAVPVGDRGASHV